MTETDVTLRILRAMGDPVRLRILRAVLEQPRNVSELVQSFDVTQPDVSHHLKRLRDAGLVEGKRKGRQIWYEPVAKPSSEVGVLLSALRRIWWGRDLGSQPPARTSFLGNSPQQTEKQRRGDIEDYLL